MHPGVGRRGPGRRRLLVLACVLAACAPVLGARAQEDDSPGLTLSLEAISPWIDDARALELDLRLRNLGTEPRDGLHVEAWLLQPVTSRSQLAAVIDGEASATFATVDAEDVALRTSSRVELRATHEELGSPGLGIYPLSIRVSDDTGLLLEQRTAVPVVTDAPATRLRIVTVLDLVSPDPPVRLHGGYDPDTIDLDGLRDQAEQLDALLGARPVIAVDAASVAAHADLADGAITRTSDGRITDLDRSSGTATAAARWLTALRAATGDGAPATAPYVPVDLGAFAASGASERIGRQFRRAEQVLTELLPREPTNALVAPALRDRDRFPIRTAIVAPEAITGTTEAPFSPELFGISTPVRADRVRLLVSDARLRELSRGDAGWVASAQTIVAESALRWLELPLVAQERLLVFSIDPAAPPSLLEHVATSFRDAPWLRRVLPGQAGAARGDATVPEAEDPVRTLSLAIPAASRAMRAIRSVVPEDASEVALARIEEWDVALLIAERVTEDAVGDETLADAVRGDIEAHLGRLRAATRDAPITLTARQGEIPVVLDNGNDFAAQVAVHLSGARLSFPGGRDMPVRLEPGTTTIDVPVEVLGQGTFSLEVSVVTPTGTVLTTTELRVRSTRVSRVASIVVGGAILFLFVQAARKRRKAPAA